MKIINRVLAITSFVLAVTSFILILLTEFGHSLESIRFISVIYGYPSLIITIVSLFISSVMCLVDNSKVNNVSLRYSLIAVVVTVGVLVFLMLELAEHM